MIVFGDAVVMTRERHINATRVVLSADLPTRSVTFTGGRPFHSHRSVILVASGELFAGQVASSALLRADYRPPRRAVASHTQGVTARLTSPPFSTLPRPPPWSSLFVEFRFLPLSLAFSLLSVVFGELLTGELPAIFLFFSVTAVEPSLNRAVSCDGRAHG